MKTINEYLITKNTKIGKVPNNRFNITEKDLIGEIENVPLEIIVLALEEQEKQKGKIDISVLQNKGIIGAFTWTDSKQGHAFWDRIYNGDYDEFYKKYPEYKKYDK